VIETFTGPRRRHVGEIRVAVRDDWQGRGVGTALMGAALDRADDWLNPTRIELHVYVDNVAGPSVFAAPRQKCAKP